MNESKILELYVFGLYTIRSCNGSTALDADYSALLSCG